MAMKSLPNGKALYTYVIINDNIIMMWALRNWFILNPCVLLIYCGPSSLAHPQQIKLPVEVSVEKLGLVIAMMFTSCVALGTIFNTFVSVHIQS